MEEQKRQGLSKVPHIFGILSLFMAYYTPLAGLIIAIPGLLMGLNDRKRGGSKVSIILNIIGILGSIAILIFNIVNFKRFI